MSNKDLSGVESREASAATLEYVSTNSADLREENTQKNLKPAWRTQNQDTLRSLSFAGAVRNSIGKQSKLQKASIY